MTIGISSGFDLNSYLTSLQGISGKTTPAIQSPEVPAPPNVLQGLISAYAGLTNETPNALFPAPDTLSTLAGQGALAPLLGALYAESMASGNAYFPTLGLSSALASSETSSLLTALNISGSGGFPEGAVHSLASLALSAYATQQKGPSFTLTDVSDLSAYA